MIERVIEAFAVNGNEFAMVGQKNDAAAWAPRNLAPASTEEARLVDALRCGDEQAFNEMVSRYHSGLLRLARVYVSSHAVAEEVVQETWLGVLQGIDRFEGRSSLKTWIFRILMNRARTRGERESRNVPFASADASQDYGMDPAEAAAELDSAAHAVHPWNVTPEQMLLSAEIRAEIERALALLPANQRQVMALRDMEEWTSEEVCNVLGISETNQRVLLHRARSKVRRALDRYFAPRSLENAAADGSQLQKDELHRSRGQRHRVSGRGVVAQPASQPGRASGRVSRVSGLS